MKPKYLIQVLLQKHHELTGLDLVNLSGGELQRSSISTHLSRLEIADEVIARVDKSGKRFYRLAPGQETVVRIARRVVVG